MMTVGLSQTYIQVYFNDHDNYMYKMYVCMYFSILFEEMKNLFVCPTVI